MIIEEAKKEEIIDDEQLKKTATKKSSTKKRSKKNSSPKKETKENINKQSAKTNTLQEEKEKIEAVKKNILIEEAAKIEAVKKNLQQNADNIQEISTNETDLKIESKDNNIVDNNTEKKEKIVPSENNNSNEKIKSIDGIPTETKSHHGLVVFSSILLIFILIICILFGLFAYYNYTNRSFISKGIYIYGVDVSGLTINEAKSKIETAFTDKLSNDVTLSYGDYLSYIKPAEIELTCDLDSAVNYAYTYGKDSNIFVDNFHIFSAMINGVNISPNVKYNNDNLKALLDKKSSELPDAVVESGYYIDGKNLIITKGRSGSIIDTNLTANIIDKKLSDLSYLNETIDIQVKKSDPKPIDINKIHTEIYSEAKNAYYTTNPYTVYPSSNGVDFAVSIEEAQNLINTSETECTIPLKTLYPSVTTNMIGQEAFPDLLSNFSTNYAASNVPRTTNLRLAANKINGYVLLPGETFSYNSVVGERTIAAGYKEAPIYQNGEVVPGLGGGICQISTTLYNAVLFANLEIVELYNHQFVPSYVSAGRDATVVYGVKDFKFKNNRNYPIKIECSVSGGIANFKLWGLKQDPEYEVSVWANVTSRTSSYIKSSTYRSIKLNGTTINTENIINSTYKAH